MCNGEPIEVWVDPDHESYQDAYDWEPVSPPTVSA
jgi:hypothetical protein